MHILLVRDERTLPFDVINSTIASDAHDVTVSWVVRLGSPGIMHTGMPVDLVVFQMMDPMSPAAFEFAWKVKWEHGGRSAIFSNPWLTFISKKATFYSCAWRSFRDHPRLRFPRFEHPTVHEESLDRSKPWIVRENSDHTVPMYMVPGGKGIDDLPPAIRDAARAIKDPVHTEFIDTSTPGRNGARIYRKYRYVVADGVGVPLHVQISHDWVTRGAGRIFAPWVVEEERAYVEQPDNCVPDLNELARALGLDYAGFDYGIDSDGRMVVWEVNQSPVLHLVKPQSRAARGIDQGYRNVATMRVVNAVIDAYRRRARAK